VGVPGGRESSAGKRRAILLLSLILLVWNVCATARQSASDRFGLSSVRTGTSPDLPAPFGNSAANLPMETPRNGPLSIRQKYLLDIRVDINKATLAELSELPGISDTVAARIVEARSRKGGFRSPEDLLGINGIKEKRLNKILPFLKKIGNN
jgi:competence ComEA-like helix-hairpin-helix protein